MNSEAHGAVEPQEARTHFRSPLRKDVQKSLQGAAFSMVLPVSLKLRSSALLVLKLSLQGEDEVLSWPAWGPALHGSAVALGPAGVARRGQGRVTSHQRSLWSPHLEGVSGKWAMS